MRRRFTSVAIVLLCGMARFSAAQDVAKLMLPSTPAFSILDFEPSSVMRPTNAKALSIDLLNSFDKDGKLLANLGIEVSPYWLSSHPTLTQQNYNYPTLAQTIIRSLSISAATVRDSASGRNKLGTGIRFKLANGQPRQEELNAANVALRERQNVLAQIGMMRAFASTGAYHTADVIDKLITTLNSAGISTQTIQQVTATAQTLLPGTPDTPDGIKTFLENLNIKVEADSKDLAKKASELLYQRKGFIVELAGAAAFDTDNSERGIEKTGFWGSASYLVSATDYLTFTGRYSRRNNDSSVVNADFGLAYLKQNTDYNIGLETMLRHYRAGIPDMNAGGQPIKRLEEQTTWRIAFQASYRLNDFISVNASFGKDFDSAFVKRSAMFSIFGLSYNLFSKLPGQLK